MTRPKIIITPVTLTYPQANKPSLVVRGFLCHVDGEQVFGMTSDNVTFGAWDSHADAMSAGHHAVNHPYGVHDAQDRISDGPDGAVGAKAHHGYRSH